MKTQISIRLGSLAVQAAARAEQLGIPIPEYIRRLIAADIGIPPPPKYRGNMQIGEQAIKGVVARWGKGAKIYRHKKKK